MPNDEKPSVVSDLPLTDAELAFIRDEGLDLLALFRKIRAREKRDLIVELVRAIADAEPPVDGH